MAHDGIAFSTAVVSSRAMWRSLPQFHAIASNLPARGSASSITPKAKTITRTISTRTALASRRAAQSPIGSTESDRPEASAPVEVRVGPVAFDLPPGLELIPLDQSISDGSSDHLTSSAWRANALRHKGHAARATNTIGPGSFARSTFREPQGGPPGAFATFPWPSFQLHRVSPCSRRLESLASGLLMPWKRRKSGHLATSHLGQKRKRPPLNIPFKRPPVPSSAQPIDSGGHGRWMQLRRRAPSLRTASGSPFS